MNRSMGPIMTTLTHTDIQNRRAEVEEQLNKAKSVIEALQSELADLDATERTFSRMGGAERRGPSAPNRPPSASAGKSRAKAPKTTSDRIAAVIREIGRKMEPREIADAMDAKGWGPVNRDAVRTRIWHMVRDGKLIKDGPAYRLPSENENPADAEPTGDASTGLFGNPAQGGEARPGGGT